MSIHERARARILRTAALVVWFFFLAAILPDGGVRVVDGSASFQTKHPEVKRPNIVIVLTDDLDWTLGGTHASTLQRTRRLIGGEGTTFSNWFVQTPVCCPSRAELLTGKLFHNLQLPGQNAGTGCMHIDVKDDVSHPFYCRDYFAQHFAKLNYTVGIFGKHLNSENPSNFLPPGVDEMLINSGGVYTNPTFTVGTHDTMDPPRTVRFDNCTNTTGMPCYSTSIIGNASLGWIDRHLHNVGHDQQKPFLAVISVKAPHILDGPGFPKAVPAPWYQNTTIPESQAPRTPNYNYSATDHHWIVRTQLPLTQEEARQVDALYISRLKTLMSVDDLAQSLMQQLEDNGILDETYVVFTSDNGFRLGQFRMPQCKLHAYENDIRVPMMIRGPGIPINVTSSLLATHADLMPTLLGLVTKAPDNFAIPSTMDGRNLAPRLRTENSPASASSSAILVEYISLGDVVRYNHSVDTYNHSFVALRLLRESHPEDVEEATQDTPWLYYWYDYPSNQPKARNFNSASTKWLLQNMKYVEYRDSRVDWNATKPPLEREVFDLDRDPYELHNLLPHISPLLLRALQLKLQRLLWCQGETCREEHDSGLANYAEDIFSAY